MNWFVIALISAAILAAVNILDSHLITKRMPSVWAYLLFAGVSYIVFGWLLLAIKPFPQAVPQSAMFMALAGSVLRGLGIMATLYIMASEEVSRALAVSNIFPIFVAISAVPFLGETISYLDWAAIVTTVAGAVLISVRWNSGGQIAGLRMSFGILLAASLFLGLGTTASKYALEYMSSWNLYTINALSMAFMFLAVSLRPSVLRSLKDVPQPRVTLPLVILNEVVAPVSVILGFVAVQMGPVSLVSAVIGARPLFVFLFALALSRAFPSVLNEKFTRGTAILKFVSVAMIVAGIATISLG